MKPQLLYYFCCSYLIPFNTSTQLKDLKMQHDYLNSSIESLTVIFWFKVFRRSLFGKDNNSVHMYTCVKRIISDNYPKPLCHYMRVAGVRTKGYMTGSQ